MKRDSLNLFGGKFEPITFGVGFVNAPFEIFKDALLSWRKNPYTDLSVKLIEDEEGGALSLIKSLQWSCNAEILLETNSDWVAYFDNGLDGTKAEPMGYFAHHLGCATLSIVCRPNLPRPRGVRGLCGARRITIFDGLPSELSGLRRWIAVTHSGSRWGFDHFGEPLEFEEIDKYESPRVQERFTRDMLVRYCNALGVPLTDDSFFKNKGILISTAFKHKEILVEYDDDDEVTLKERRRQLGLDT